MNWTLALPEIVLACAGLRDPARRRDPEAGDLLPRLHGAIGALLLAAVLVLGQGEGAALRRPVTSPTPSAAS